MGVLEGKELLLYSFPSPHPFTSARVMRFWDEVRKKGLDVRRLAPQKAEKNLIELFHTKEHIRYSPTLVPSGKCLPALGRPKKV